MPKQTTNKRQRPTRTPPHVSLKILRMVAGLTIDELIQRINTATGNRYTRGAISAMESGTRGASAQFLGDLAAAYGIDSDDIATDYLPRVYMKQSA